MNLLMIIALVVGGWTAVSIPLAVLVGHVIGDSAPAAEFTREGHVPAPVEFGYFEKQAA